MLLDLSLLLNKQVAAAARSACYQLQPFLAKKELAVLMYSLVTSRLGYCNSLCMGLPLEAAQKLQLIKNTAASMLMTASKFDHGTPILHELNWLPVAFRSQFKVLYLFLFGIWRIFSSHKIQLIYCIHPRRLSSVSLPAKIWQVDTRRSHLNGSTSYLEQPLQRWPPDSIFDFL